MTPPVLSLLKNLDKQGFDVSFLHSRSFRVPEPRDSPIKNCDTSLSHAVHARLITRQRLLILFHIIVVLQTILANHLSSLSSGTGTEKIFEGKLEGRRGRGRPRFRWINDVEDDLRKLGVKRWRTKALEREE